MSKDETVERISPELIAQLNALASRLTAQGEYEAVDLIDTVVARVSAMPGRELLREALKALEPFGTWADHHRTITHAYYIPECEIDGPGHTLTLTLEDFRRARAAADKIRAALTEPA